MTAPPAYAPLVETHDALHLVAQKVGLIDSRLRTLQATVDEGFDAINERARISDAKVDALAARVDGIDAKVDSLSARVDRVDAKVDRVDAKVDGVVVQIAALDANMLHLNSKMEQLIGLILKQQAG
jgi:outer membrane murein-binding lipoprotein Lpp